MDIALLLAGGLLLYAGAEWLVGGATRLALALRVPQLIIGLTVVAYGTSAPEVVVSIQAGRAGLGAVAIGNVIGSNIANIGLILGVAAMIKPARIDGALRRRELPALLASALALPAVLLDGVVERWEGITLLLAAAVYTGWMLRSGRNSDELREATADTEASAGVAAAAGAPPSTSRLRNGVIAIVGLAVLLGGGHLFVESATRIAQTHGISERVVGLTVVAIGTSLPELATAIIAARRGNSDIAVGNVVGSNIFNVFLCLGATSALNPIQVTTSLFVGDLAALGGITFLGLVFLRNARTITRVEGGILTACYALFVAVRAFGS